LGFYAVKLLGYDNDQYTSMSEIRTNWGQWFRFSILYSTID